MSERMVGKPKYGNWVSKRIIVLPSVVGFLFLGLALLYSLLVIPAILFFLVAMYFLYAHYLFAPRGGNVQNKIWELILSHLDWNGEGQALDIGCGDAALTIKLAKRYPKARIIGIDYWGESWEYSKNVCEQNAKIEGVNEHVAFQKASASSLPFDDGYFDAAVSNLVFHEVSDTTDKREVIREALRVVKKGGKFAFQDLFLWKRIYGDPDDLVRAIRSWGVNKVEFIPTKDSAFIPKALKLSFMVGTMGIITGEK